MKRSWWQQSRDLLTHWFGKRKRQQRRAPWRKSIFQSLEPRLPLVAELVSNINTGGTGGSAGSDPQFLTVVGNEIYFTADNGQNGRELWRTNGDLSNAQMMDIRVGVLGSNPDNLTNVNNNLYFTATDGQTGVELYVVQAGGSPQLINIAPQAGVGSTPSSLTNVNNVLFFAADDGSTQGRELWYTTSVASVAPISIRSGGAGSFPTSLANVNGTLYLSANDGSTGNELWTVAPGANTATQVKDINGGGLGSNPTGGTNVNGRYFFYATDGSVAANELWVSDGSSSGTFLVRDINTFLNYLNGQSNVQNITNFGGFAYFSAAEFIADQEPYISNGTSSGTFLIKDIAVNTVSVGDSSPANFTVVDNRLFFTADEDPTVAVTNRELYVINGPGSFTTTRVKDIFVGATGSTPQYLINADGMLYFAASDGIAGGELWRSDGTATGTVLDTDVNLTPTLAASSNPQYLAYFNGYVYFGADNGVVGRELFRVKAVLPNFAPVLNNSGNPFLNSITEDIALVSNAGTTINTLIGSVSPPVTMITDADVGQRQGIAIIAADTSAGSWQYTTNSGATWFDFPAVSDTNALLLAADFVTSIRLVPAPDYFGTLSTAITFRAWDTFRPGTYSGNNGTTAAITTTGGSTSFSNAIETASITVTPRADDVPAVAGSVPEDTQFPGVIGVSPNFTISYGAQPIVIAPNVVDNLSLTGFRITGLNIGTLWYDAADPANLPTPPAPPFILTPFNAGSTATINVYDVNNDQLTFYYQPPANYYGPVTFTVQGVINGVAAGTPTQITITVTPVADFPSITATTTQEDTQSTTGLVITRNPFDGLEVTHFRISGIVNGTLFQNDGVTQINNGDLITAFQGSAGLKFTPALNFNGPGATFDVQGATSATGAGLSGAIPANITVTAVNDAPVNTVPTNQIALENASWPFSAATGNPITVSDVDVGGANVTVQLSISSGTLSVSPVGGVSGNNTNSVQIIGTVSAVNNVLNTLQFIPTPGFTNNTAFLDVLTVDGGSTGAGGTRQDQDTIAITVLPQNIAPTLTVPGAQTFAEDTVRFFSIGNGNVISVGDADAGTRPIQVRLQASLGSLAFSAIDPATTVVGGGTNTVTVTGPQANINNTLGSLAYTPVLNYNGAASIAINANDLGAFGFGGPQTSNATVNLTITAVNDVPTNTILAAQSTNENTPLVLQSASRLSISDVDAAASNVTVRLTVGNGTVSVLGVGGVTIGANGSSNVLLTGSLANINNALAIVTYTPTNGFSGNDSLTMVTNDLGNTGSGGSRTDTDTMVITVLNFNKPPVHTIPGPQAGNEDVPIVFSTGNGNRISVSDVDSALNSIRTTLTATNGTLTLGSIVGVTVSGNGTANVTINGPVANISTALNNLVFTPNLNYQGPATITLFTTDFGFAGLGGVQTDTDTISISLASSNDAPVNTFPATQDGGVNTPVIFSPGTGNGVQISDVDAGIGLMQITFTVTNGTLTLGDASAVSVTGDGSPNLQVSGNISALNAALNNLRFQPNTGFSGVANIQMVTNDRGNSGAGGALLDTDTFSVRVRSAIEIDGPNIYVTGSNIDDVMSLTFTSNTNFTVNINGQTHSTNTATINNVRFTGGVGNDRLTINDSPLASSAVFSPFVVQVNAAGYAIRGETTETIVFNGGVNDTATFNDSAGDDSFIASPNNYVMTGAGYSNSAVGVGNVTVNATTGNDVAQLNDSAGNDYFVAYPTAAYLYLPGLTYAVNNFDAVYARGSAGTDVASFIDSPGNDTFYGLPTYSILQGPGYQNRTDGFDFNYAFVASGNTAGNDQALYYDSTGSDIYYALQYYSLIYGTGYFNQAVGFDNSVANASAGGYDYAIFFDTTGNDTLAGYSNQMLVTGDPLIGVNYSALGFDYMNALSSFGGGDKAQFFDSAGVDTFYGLVTHSGMTGPGYFLQAVNYVDVRVNGGSGGADVAILYGSIYSDTLVGQGSFATVTYASPITRIVGVSRFGTVQAVAQGGGTDRRTVQAIDYSMQVYGSWLPA